VQKRRLQLSKIKCSAEDKVMDTKAKVRKAIAIMH